MTSNLTEWLRPPARFVRRLPASAKRSLRCWLRPSTVSLHGVRLPVSSLSREMQDLLYLGQYETREFQLAQAHLTPSDRVLEIGTGLGYLSVICSRICGAESVTTYEANPEMVPIIESTFRLNSVTPELRQAAITRRGEPVEFRICTNFWSSSTIERDGTARTVTVPGVAFTEAVEQRNATFLLMDLEGGEIDLVDETIPASVRHLVIELHEHVVGAEGVGQVRRWLTKNGFEVVVDDGDRSTLYCRRNN